MAVSTTIFNASHDSLGDVKTYLGGATADAFLNKETVHDSQRDIDADVFNRIIAGLAECARRIRIGNHASIAFEIANLTASQTNLALALALSDLTSEAAFMGGSVTGFVATLQNACTAGTCDIWWSKAGVKQTTITAQLNSTTNTTKVRVRQLPGVETITALDLLGIMVTTSADFAAGATPTLRVTLFISYGEEEAV